MPYFWNKEDILQQKQRELDNYMGQFNGAVSLITNTIDSLSDINQAINNKVSEIEAYQADLEDTKNGLLNAQSKNAKVIANFRALLGED